MASTDVLDQLLCILNERISFAEKSSKLHSLKNTCEETILKEATKKDDRKVFVCEFSQLQFPRSEQQRCANHFAVR